MPRRRASRRHKVNVHLQVFEISKAGTSLDLEIFSAGQKLGELQIGRGSINWRGGQRKITKRIRWSCFADMMNHLAYGGSR